MPTKIRRKVYKDESWSDTIISDIKKGEVVDITKILPLVTPGTELRKGLDEILNGNLGALIVLGINDELKSLLQGGINLDVPYGSSRLFELAKMDGAIVVSNDLKKIVSANTHLMPNKEIPSSETGIRHRSAEQTARQTGLPVIAISHRRSIISLFYRDQKYVLQDLRLLLVKSNNSLNNLKDYRIRIDSDLNYLIHNEINSLSTVSEDALSIIQKLLYFFKHSSELDMLVIELGEQGTDIMQSLYEINYGIEETLAMLILDYSSKEMSKQEALTQVENLKKMGLRMISDTDKLSEFVSLGSSSTVPSLDFHYPRGYRILSKIPRLSPKLIEDMIKKYKCISNMLNLDAEELSKDLSINLVQAKYIVSQLSSLSENITTDFFDI
ncbi:MAG: DNA integrity scanning diadenylate cyclase DisA [archaeon]